MIKIKSRKGAFHRLSCQAGAARLADKGVYFRVFLPQVAIGKLTVLCGIRITIVRPFAGGGQLLVDHSAAALTNFCCGANSAGQHLINANWHIDANWDEVLDLRNVIEGDLSPI